MPVYSWPSKHFQSVGSPCPQSFVEIHPWRQMKQRSRSLLMPLSTFSLSVNLLEQLENTAGTDLRAESILLTEETLGNLFSQRYSHYTIIECNRVPVKPHSFEAKDVLSSAGGRRTSRSLSPLLERLSYARCWPIWLRLRSSTAAVHCHLSQNTRRGVTLRPRSPNHEFAPTTRWANYDGLAKVQ